jgi:hypothetical protein
MLYWSWHSFHYCRNGVHNISLLSLRSITSIWCIDNVYVIIFPCSNVELSVKSCPVGRELHPSFDASSPPSCCPQSHEMLLNKGMKYWDWALNAPGSRTSITTVHIATTMIGWRHSGKEMTVQTQFSTETEFHISLKSIVLFFCCFLKSHPLCDQTGASSAVFSWLYGYNFIMCAAFCLFKL